MTEIDFSREHVPHTQGTAPHFEPSEADKLTRTEIVPLLAELTPEEREKFDKQLVKYFCPEAENSSRFAAQLVLRQLSLEQLEQVSATIVSFQARKVLREMDVIY